jgi:excisionase family DNA binding protein
MSVLQNNLMGVDALSHYLNISMCMVYKLVREAKIPFYRIGKLIKFDVKDIDLWKVQMKIEPKVG